MSVSTPPATIEKHVRDVKAAFATGVTLPEAFRREQLRALTRCMEEQEDVIAAALREDMGKSHGDSMNTEICYIKSQCAHALNHLSEWMEPKPVTGTGPMFLTDSAQLRNTPVGTTLIIGAWNYPFQLTLGPLVGAIAAGCTAVIKPSEIAKKSAYVMAQIIPKYLDNNCYKLVMGAARETTQLIDEKFDMIFFTGGTAIGKLIYQRASQNLTPCILELGGKNPVYVADDCDMRTVARRVTWGRFAFNSGQTCIAPEYVLCSKEAQAKLIPHMKATIEEFYGADPKKSEDYNRIVNDRHFARIRKLVEDTVESGKGQVVAGGTFDEGTRYIAPTIMTVAKDAPIMQEEVFGPVLQLVECTSPEEAIQFINARDRPLAMYVFSPQERVQNQIVDSTDAGGVCINDTIMQFMVPDFPFGGTGGSGIGRYHDKYSFRAFTHEKPVLNKARGLEFINSVRYPPFSHFKVGLVQTLMFEKEQSMISKYGRTLFAAFSVAAAALFIQSKL